MKANDFKPGDSVLRVPPSAKGDVRHDDCKRGIVASINARDEPIMVAFDIDGRIANLLRATPEPCEPDDLISIRR